MLHCNAHMFHIMFFIDILHLYHMPSVSYRVFLTKYGNRVL